MRVLLCRIDGSVIAVLLLVNGLLAFNEDLRARKAMRELMKSLQVMTRVKRFVKQRRQSQGGTRGKLQTCL